MKKLGKTQSLEVLRFTGVGAYLNDIDESSDTDVLLPTKYVPDDIEVGDMIEVFLYNDSEDRLIATTLRPELEVGEIAELKVVDVTSHGAFLSWGLEKDLFLPYKEQTYKVKKGDKVVVMLYVDLSDRLSATMKISGRLEVESTYHPSDWVTGTIYQIHDEIGAFVAVDNKYHGLVPKSECFGELKAGQKIEARVTFIKEDGKLDLALREKVATQIHSDVDVIKAMLEEADGFLPYNDYSNPDEIKQIFKMSKRAFKRSIGVLLKEGYLEIVEKGIQKK
ncbi:MULTISPECIES: S1 RNA-binding domain-containing protein [unclassified Fusibacter]|uniref:CvfB family protein n=1 Tax=unclassified Fusibacter TaxID=2624464 RepID=UPI001010520B|nr:MULTISPECIES: S1-like domain-containing RNA-binding protein [unclassified Fusibacter]MCK8059997.1 S1-like domain-containing RNA-binding protein [Fusibacter sp. A2]NPE22137.1 RNA-binding protein [Fusibacter sp. A1]RXV60916.1 RNA-binding protein [Fusibacter sp. A1]